MLSAVAFEALQGVIEEFISRDGEKRPDGLASLFLAPSFPFAALFFRLFLLLLVHVRQHGAYPLAPLGVIVVQLDLFVEIGDGVVYQLVRIILCLYVIEGVAQFMAEQPRPVRVAYCLPCLLVDKTM